MSAHEHVDSPGTGIRLGAGARGSDERPGVGPALWARLGVADWSVYAWAAVAAAVTFIAITCWWLTQDRSVPIYDAGDQLETALEYHNMLAAGNLLGPFTHESVYPILGHMVGALAAFVGGVNVAAPIIGENVVFIPLLALGSYQTGRLLFGSMAGLLAVVFALGTALLTTMFHVFMLDGPLTALVSVSVWLILASEDFKRTPVAALAGLAVGLGLNTKIQFALYLLGLTLIVVLHGGWRNKRGLITFAAVAAVVGLPWYVVHISELGHMFELASGGPGTPAGNIPPRLSSDNFLWYFWSVLNSQLLAPLAILAAIGAVWSVIDVVRARARNVARFEFLAGAIAAWAVITFVSIHHDIRYGLPLLAFVSVIATGWITRLPRAGMVAAIGLLALGVATNVLALDFGVGKEVKLALAASLPDTEQLPDRLIVYSTNGFLDAAPSRDGDVPGLLQELHREGVRTVEFSAEQTAEPDFSFEGLKPLSMIANLTPFITRAPEYSASPSVATFIHVPVAANAPAPCARLSDGTGVWVVRYDTATSKLAFYCPSRRPQYYNLGSRRR
jgi:hypothetical protein